LPKNIESDVIAANQKLCVGSTCITEDQLKALINQSGQQAASPAQNSDASPSAGGATTTVTDARSTAPDSTSSAPTDQTTQDAATPSL
jgi:hypothetical protein